MPVIPPDLANLRRRIDEIDDRMHELLIERAEVVARVAASKKAEAVAFYQPGREAQILRRLVARHRGLLPIATVLRIWREMLAATVRIETRFAVAVVAPAEGEGAWDLARDHYGSQVPMSAHPSAGRVIRAVAEGEAAVGILPMPREDDPDPWWCDLVSPNDQAPRVIARLPFGFRGNARGSSEALAIGHCAQQETGADRTFFIAESTADLSRGRCRSLLLSAGLACTFLASADRGGSNLHLIEIDGFVPISDQRIGRFNAQLGPALYRLLPFGGYALPLAASALSPAAAKG